MVRSTRGHADEGERERERGGRMYAYTCMRLIRSHAHEDTLYRRPWLRLSSSLRVAWARRHLFFPRSNNSWGQPFWELAAARSYCSTVALNARLRASELSANPSVVRIVLAEKKIRVTGCWSWNLIVPIHNYDKRETNVDQARCIIRTERIFTLSSGNWKTKARRWNERAVLFVN